LVLAAALGMIVLSGGALAASRPFCLQAGLCAEFAGRRSSRELAGGARLLTHLKYRCKQRGVTLREVAIDPGTRSLSRLATDRYLSR
jgi:hypothetical protein